MDKNKKESPDIVKKRGEIKERLKGGINRNCLRYDGELCFWQAYVLNFVNPEELERIELEGFNKGLEKKVLSFISSFYGISVLNTYLRNYRSNTEYLPQLIKSAESGFEKPFEIDKTKLAKSIEEYAISV